MKEEAAPETVREEIRVWLHDRGVESPERAADLLAATIGAGEPEVIDRAALFAAWRTAIEVAARRSPLVLVFEDLHWSSDSLLDLVEFIVQPRGDAAVLMIALTRPELLDRRPAWGGGRRNYVAMSLEPLSDDSVAQLVRHMVGPTAPQIVERVVARAEGNPFFAGEIVQSIRERVLSLSDVAAVEHALATLPDTIQATILARLDLLEPRSDESCSSARCSGGRSARPESPPSDRIWRPTATRCWIGSSGRTSSGPRPETASPSATS